MHVGCMIVMIQIRNVPEELHRQLKSRAALAGMSLSDYLLAEIRQVSERPTLAELRGRLERHAQVIPPLRRLGRSAMSATAGDRGRCVGPDPGAVADAGRESRGTGLFDGRQALHAPHLLDVEVAQVIRRYAANGQMDADRGCAALAILADFPIPPASAPVHAAAHLGFAEQSDRP
jgi:antitoxin FitA